jgi:hypothetical protein
MNERLQALVSRKFILSVLVLGSASVLCWFAKIDGIVWGSVAGGIVTGYYAINVIQKKAT